MKPTSPSISLAEIAARRGWTIWRTRQVVRSLKARGVLKTTEYLHGIDEARQRVDRASADALLPPLSRQKEVSQ